MTAVIVTGGKQYKVTEGDIIYIEKLECGEGDVITFDNVLAIVDGENSKFGAPAISGANVTGRVIKNGRGKKITVIKFKAKKNYRRKQGHRQPYTKIQIETIAG